MTEPTVEVSQSDRDAAADVWRDYIARTGEIIVERNMRKGGLDDGIPTIFARHRIEAEQRGRLAGMEEAAEIILAEAVLWKPGAWADVPTILRLLVKTIRAAKA